MLENAIEKLIFHFSKLPGIGQRSARRIVLHLINNREILLPALTNALQDASAKIVQCSECGNIDVYDICSICSDPKRDQSVICVIETVSELWALERSNFFKGIYHVLGGTLSSAHGKTPSDLSIDALIRRAEKPNVSEIIVATNATLEGQTTAFYLMDKLEHLNIKISKLAYGIPVGGELDYLDEGTITAAFQSRRPF